MAESMEGTSGVKLAAAWLLVGIPLLWGLWMTIGNAMALFQ